MENNSDNTIAKPTGTEYKAPTVARGAAIFHEEAENTLKTQSNNIITAGSETTAYHYKEMPSVNELLNHMVKTQASDLYITFGAAPSLRINGEVEAIANKKVNTLYLEEAVKELLSETQINEFNETLEFNGVIEQKDGNRFRINVYKQQSNPAIVIRYIKNIIPTIKSLGLPPIYSKTVMKQKGLVLLVGQTGSGKSTSLAAMIDYRNENMAGHIITIEDPIEYVHKHKKSIVSQRDLGIDTYSIDEALKNALRQQPDVVLIGEIRDKKTMEHAINFAETGHLCLATLHANNANQAIDRILSFFSSNMHSQVLLNLSLNLRAIISQALIPNIQGTRSMANEVLLNEGLIKELIKDGKIKEIKEVMADNSDVGMHSFDQSLFYLYTNGEISEETALSYADSSANLQLQISQTRPASSSFDNDDEYKLDFIPEVSADSEKTSGEF